MASDLTNADHARHLMLIARELRELGIDPPLVHLSEEGVTDTGMTLVDELWLIASQLDWDTAMSIKLDGEQHG
jgi:hypothetical protein